MKKNTFIKSFLLKLSLPLLFTSLTFASNQSQDAKQPTLISLSDMKPNWVSVMLGDAICTPLRNSYGYLSADDGRILTAFNENGNIIWKKGFSSRIKPYITVGPADMIYVITREGELNMLNPGGQVLWTKRTGLSIIESPLCAGDGKVYVRSSDAIACYGTKGICMWKTKIHDQNTQVPITELKDGSLLVFSSTVSEGRSVGYLIDQYGTVSEPITFAGQVSQAVSTKDGTLLTFTDGSAGLCNEEDGNIVSKWVIRTGDLGLSYPTYAITEGFNSGTAALMTGNTSKIIIINTDTGEELSEFETNYAPIGLSFKGKTVQGLVLADRDRATCYDVDGTVIWNVALNKGKNWTRLIPSDSGYLILFTQDWTMEGYRIKQTISTSKLTSYFPQQLYVSPIPDEEMQKVSSDATGRAISKTMEAQMTKAFEKGNYGENSKEWTLLLRAEMQALADSWLVGSSNNQLKTSFYRKNPRYAQTIMRLASKNGTAAYNKNFITLMKRVDDPLMLSWVIQDVGEMSYDPDGSILSTLELLSNRQSLQGEELVLKEICDATVKICKYMGRPAFFACGKTILTNLTGRQYSQATRNYARSSLTKFLDIKI